MYPVFILAGGLGTRLGTLTKHKPKSLIMVNGKPFIFWQLKYLARQGIKEVVICVGHMSEQIESYVSNGVKFNVDVKYSYDRGSPLGTGGAVLNALKHVGDDFFVIYGDSLLPINFRDVISKYVENKKKPLMTVYKNMNNLDKSNVLYKKNKLEIYDKLNPTGDMKHVDYGLSILNKNIFCKKQFPDKFDLSELFNLLSIKNKLIGYEVMKRFYEVGSHEGIEDTAKFLEENHELF
jgi:N-acetyl-alpha-D-muramate 1-phosphate uridylyltransferase